MPDNTTAGPESPGTVPELLDTAPCGFLSFADDGRIQLVNRTLLNVLGYSSGELIGRHIESIFTKATRIFYQTHWFPLLRLHGHAEEIFLMLSTSSGEEIGVLVNAVRREHGSTHGYDCVVMRVRERQKYETELLRARRAADAARAEAETKNRELERANVQLEQQTHELLEQQDQLEKQAAELEAASEELHELNERLVERSVELERQRAIAEEANHAKSAFLAVMSHELRTPLNAISGYVELMLMQIQGPITNAQRDALDRIRRSQQHLLRLINDILNLSRIEAGRVDYDIAAISVDEVIANVSPMVQPQLSSKELAFEIDIAAGLCVQADREKLEQILLNLIGNAIKFTPPGGSVRVAAQAAADAPDTALIAVHDTGIGIAAEKVGQVFEPFVQVHVDAPAHGQGTGLGLAISRDLARGMSADLHVDSVEGLGSTFTISLPRAHSDALPAEAARTDA